MKMFFWVSSKVQFNNNSLCIKHDKHKQCRNTANASPCKLKSGTGISETINTYPTLYQHYAQQQQMFNKSPVISNAHCMQDIFNIVNTILRKTPQLQL